MDGGAYQRNLARFAEAWLDEESIEKFYKVCNISIAAFASRPFVDLLFTLGLVWSLACAAPSSDYRPQAWQDTIRQPRQCSRAAEEAEMQTILVVS
jgi:hypothetical protein